MTVRKIAARELIVQVSDGAGVPTWLGIAGLNNHAFNPGENEESTNTTDYTSAGEYEGLIMQRGGSLKLEGFQMRDHLTDALDAGQARCEVLGAAKAYGSLGAIRFRYPASSTWKVWNGATFSLGEQGGGNNDMGSWSVTITRSGAATTAVAP